MPLDQTHFKVFFFLLKFGKEGQQQALPCVKFILKLQYISALLTERQLYVNHELVSCQSRLRKAGHTQARRHCLHLLRLDECNMHDKQNIVRLDYSRKQRSTKAHGANINIQSSCQWNAIKYHSFVVFCISMTSLSKFLEKITCYMKEGGKYFSHIFLMKRIILMI